MKTKQLQKNIPSEWQQVKLGDISDIFSGGTPDTNNQHFWNGKINWITPTEITKTGKYIENETEKKITELGLKNSSAKLLPKGSLVICTRATVGECSISTYPISTNQGFKNLIPKNNTTIDYLYYYIKSIKHQLIKLGSGSTFLEVSKGDIGKLKLKLPPLLEQNRIVSVLETWDKSIENLNKKIEIKKQIKKGLMQDLLTGKKRLSGFEDKWEIVTLGDVGEFRTSSVDKKTDQNQKIAFLCNYMDVYKRKVIKNTDIFQKITAKESQFESSSLEVGDVLFTPSSETPEDIGYSAVVQSTLPNLLFSYHLVRFRPNKSVLNISYSSFCFNQVSFRKYLSSVAAGVTRFTLSKSAFENATVNLPSVGEQKAIAEILTTADNEISVLEKKLEIFKEQKRYLLNNLITGAIRTPENLSVK